LKYIASIKNDDISAFEQVYINNYERLYTYYLRKTGSSFIAEELAQETFIKLWVYRKTLSEEIPIAAQIFRIAKTIFIDTLKKRKLEIVAIEDVHGTYFSNEEGDLLETKEFAQMLYGAVNNLPPIRQKVFKMSREEGLSHQAIAEQLAISPKSVNNHITKAIQQLKQLIATSGSLIVVWLNLPK
jgi:RNA polymerase sigma-70 factor (ECF subfamily)